MSDLDEFNERMRERAEEWRRTELPKIRNEIFRTGFASIEQIRDNIVTEDELRAAGFERDDANYSRNWHRVGFG